MKRSQDAGDKPQLRYVAAYEQIHDMIKRGEIRPGEKLPSENELTAMLKVSRGTVRQALILLREGGLIYNHQGKGNFLRAGTGRERGGLEQVHSSPERCATVPIESRSLTVEYYPSTPTMQEYLEREESTLLAQFHVTLYAEGMPVAYRLCFVPFEHLEQAGVNLDSDEQLLAFLDGFVEEQVVSGSMEMSCVEARESVAERLERTPGTPLLLFSETMRRKNGRVALYSKGYFDPNYFCFSIQRT